MEPPTIEELLRSIEESAAMLRYLAGAATAHIEPPNQTVLGGIENVCENIEDRARAIRDSLTLDVREEPLRRPRRH
jgi:hypothetical protein